MSLLETDSLNERRKPLLGANAYIAAKADELEELFIKKNIY